MVRAGAAGVPARAVPVVGAADLAGVRQVPPGAVDDASPQYIAVPYGPLAT